ncbi:hypothetical protein [Scytonema sp. PRP1]|uniref:hypothetical protein n=1 Tax=Scytonema sp. PRP1 TaxID=3120513 RepID=UPI002FD62DB9
MVKNEAVTKATLEAKEWEGELDDADLTAVSGGEGYVTQYFENLGEAASTYFTDLGNRFADAAKKAFG